MRTQIVRMAQAIEQVFEQQLIALADLEKNGAPERIRTSDPQIRSLVQGIVLYGLHLQTGRFLNLMISKS